jgi:hypothetical protein
MNKPTPEPEAEIGAVACAPCPVCKQYSHSIPEDAIAAAFMHFQSMTAHPVRGHPMGHAFDDATRDAAQVLVTTLRNLTAQSKEV